MGEKLIGILLNKVQTDTFDNISDKTCEFIKAFRQKGPVVGLDVYTGDMIDLRRKYGGRYRQSDIEFSDMDILFMGAVGMSTPHRVTALTNDMPEFLALYEKAQAEGIPTHNPFNVVQDFVGKQYLLRLQQAGIPVVPTTKIESLDDLLHCPPGIVKPLVSERGIGTEVVDQLNEQQKIALYERFGSGNFYGTEQGLIYQPYMNGFIERGERKLMVVDEEILLPRIHTLGSYDGEGRPVMAWGRDQTQVDVNPYNPSVKEQDLVRDIQGWLDNNGYNPSFYRVDIVTDANENPYVSELEMLNPSPATEDFIYVGRRDLVDDFMNKLYASINR